MEKGGSDTDRNTGGMGEEHRRNSAPEMEEWQRPSGTDTPPLPAQKVVQRLTQPAIPPQPLIVEPNPTRGWPCTAAARVVSRLALVFEPACLLFATVHTFGLVGLKHHYSRVQ